MAQSLAAVAATERRIAERLATTLRGKVFPGPVDCVVADFNKRGARLRFAEPPPAFRDKVVLVVWSSGFVFEAQMRWSAGEEVGVQFLSSRDLRRPVPTHLAPIQALWRKRRPRVARRTLVKQAPIIDARRAKKHPAWMKPRATKAD